MAPDGSSPTQLTDTPVRGEYVASWQSTSGTTAPGLGASRPVGISRMPSGGPGVRSLRLPGHLGVLARLR
jgi:hypothetical protein